MGGYAATASPAGEPSVVCVKPGSRRRNCSARSSLSKRRCRRTPVAYVVGATRTARLLPRHLARPRARPAVPDRPRARPGPPTRRRRPRPRQRACPAVLPAGSPAVPGRDRRVDPAPAPPLKADPPGRSRRPATHPHGQEPPHQPDQPGRLRPAHLRRRRRRHRGTRPRPQSAHPRATTAARPAHVRRRVDELRRSTAAPAGGARLSPQTALPPARAERPCGRLTCGEKPIGGPHVTRGRGELEPIEPISENGKAGGERRSSRCPARGSSVDQMEQGLAQPA